MENGPELIKINENEFNCSLCGDFKVEVRKWSETLWASIQADFAEHVKRRHSIPVPQKNQCNS